MPIKVAVIGAGSLTFTRRLARDILCVPELRDARFSFTDIDPVNLDRAVQLCAKDIADNGLKARVAGFADRRRALRDADYVINLARIGGLRAFQLDIDIPLKYGVDQCVGDTLCPGGILYGQRGIAAMLDFCRDVRAVAPPHCLMLNYGNPNAMLTWAANEFGRVRTIGLCHGVQGGHWQIARVIERLVNGRRKPGAAGYVPVTERDVDIVCAGLNHQTWYLKIRYRGEDWTGRMLEGFEQHPQFSRTERCRIDVLRRFGYYSTESNGHLSEYLPWYRKTPRDIRRWIDPGSWIGGETGGYLRVCTEARNDFDLNFGAWMKAAPWNVNDGHRTHEHGSYIIESLETRRPYRGHFNVVNSGCISNLPDDCVVEAPGYVDGNGIGIPRVGPLPLACAATLSATVNVQRMSVHAAVAGDVTLLKQAVLHDPLTGAVCDPEAVWQMVDEMLVAQARWLPQYRDAIPAARRRLAAARRAGAVRGAGRSRGAFRVNPRKASRRPE